MHALLACAALHIAHLNPDQHRDMTIKARTHQSHAIPLFRAAVSIIDSETSDAVLLFARLISISAFALDERLYVEDDQEDQLPSWLFFIRNGCK